jgi:hypothetical protein
MNQAERIAVRVEIKQAHLTEFAELGAFTAALLGSFERWPGTDLLEAIAEKAAGLGMIIGDQNPEQLAYWRRLADAMLIEHDAEEVDDEDDEDES